MDQTGLQPAPDFHSTLGSPVQPAVPLSRAFFLIPLCGLIGGILAIAVYRPLDSTRFLSVGFVSLFAILILIAHVQQRARRGGDISSFFPMIYWLAFLPAILALALWLNGTLDHSVPESHRELVTRKYISHSRHGTSYYIEFTSWRPNRTTESVGVHYRDYAQLRVDDPILVEVHRGALAIPWIGGVRKADEE